MHLTPNTEDFIDGLDLTMDDEEKKCWKLVALYSMHEEETLFIQVLNVFRKVFRSEPIMYKEFPIYGIKKSKGNNSRTPIQLTEEDIASKLGTHKIANVKLLSRIGGEHPTNESLERILAALRKLIGKGDVAADILQKIQEADANISEAIENAEPLTIFNDTFLQSLPEEVAIQLLADVPVPKGDIAGPLVPPLLPPHDNDGSKAPGDEPTTVPRNYAAVPEVPDGVVSSFMS
uniref:Uncharacterized protein n=1 Tax=Panagrolaimus superbus TaxID=310955 RepID=A0A914YBC1_9BILA